MVRGGRSKEQKVLGIQDLGDQQAGTSGWAEASNSCVLFWGSFCPHTNHSDPCSSFQRCPLPTKDQSHSPAMGGQSCLWWQIHPWI